MEEGFDDIILVPLRTFTGSIKAAPNICGRFVDGNSEMTGTAVIKNVRKVYKSPTDLRRFFNITGKCP